MKPIHLYAAVAVLVLALAGHAYLGMRIGAAQQDQFRKDVQEQVKQIRAELNDKLAEIAKDKKQVKTPKQVAERLHDYVPLPKPPVYVPPTPDTEVLPDAPSAVWQNGGEDGGIFLPGEDVKPLFDKLADCKANDLKLEACQRELPLQIERAERAEKVMKGGGFWSRFKAGAKWVVIGAAGGAVTTLILKH